MVRTGRVEMARGSSTPARAGARSAVALAGDVDAAANSV
jgi:hypothetical protein